MSIEFNRRLEDIPVYPAASTYAFEGELVKLASNETPFAPHPQVLEAIEAQVRTLNRYPDPEKAALRRRISDRTGVPVGRIAVGNGSCELLLSAAEAMLEPGAEVVYAWPSFSIYPHLAAMSGARAITVPLNDAGEHDLEAMAREITAATRLVIVCNPNNPSATALPPAVIDAWVGELPRHVALVLDEAYIEFSTLQDEVERRVEQNTIERVHVESELAERGLETTESQANFSWVALGEHDEDEVVEGLAARGVIVRAGKALGEEGRMRVTYGTRHENDRFLAALDELL